MKWTGYKYLHVHFCTMFTWYWIAINMPTQNHTIIGFYLNKNSDLGMISVMKQSCMALTMKVDHDTMNRVLAVFAAVWRGTRTTVEAMQREVSRSETYWVFRKWELGFSEPNPLRQRLWGKISVQPHVCSNSILFHTHTHKISSYESRPKLHPS